MVNLAITLIRSFGGMRYIGGKMDVTGDAEPTLITGALPPAGLDNS